MQDNTGNASIHLQNAQQSKIEQLIAQLRQQFAEYDMLMESTGVCIVKVRMEDGFPVEWCNEAAYRTIGYTKEEYEAQFGYDLRSYFRGREEPFSVLMKESAAALQKGKKYFQTLVKLPSREGFFWAQSTGTFTDFDPHTGKPSCIYGVFTDVTSVVEARERLARTDLENTRLVSILDNIPVGVSVWTIEKGTPTSITVNRYLAEYLGIAGGTTIIHDLEQILAYVHKDEREKCRDVLIDFLHSGSKLDVNCRLRRGGMNKFSWVRIEGRAVSQAENIVTAYLTYTDISALKETEKTLQEAVISAKLIVWEYDIPSHTIYLADNETTNEVCLRFGIGHVVTGVPGSLAAFIDAQSMPALLEMYRKVEAGENASCEVWYKRKAGLEPRCERMSCTVDCDEQGRAIRAYAIGLNITAEKNVEERYIRERSFLRDNRDFNLISKGHFNLTQNKVLEYPMQAEKTPGRNYFDTNPGMTYDEAAEAFFRMPCPKEDLCPDRYR